MNAPDRPASGPENRDGSGIRDGKGRFRAGNVANPKGRPKDVHGIAELARSYAPAAIERLVVLARGRGSAAVAACKELLDRGLGKSPQAVDLAVRRGPDAGALGGNPDQARQRLEELIAAAQASTTTDGKSVALPEKAQESQRLIDTDAEPCPTIAAGLPPEGTP